MLILKLLISVVKNYIPICSQYFTFSTCSFHFLPERSCQLLLESHIQCYLLWCVANDTGYTFHLFSSLWIHFVLNHFIKLIVVTYLDGNNHHMAAFDTTSSVAVVSTFPQTNWGKVEHGRHTFTQIWKQRNKLHVILVATVLSGQYKLWNFYVKLFDLP